MLDIDTQKLIQDRYKIGKAYRVRGYVRDQLQPYMERCVILADPEGFEEPGADTIVSLDYITRVQAATQCFLWQDKLWNGDIIQDDRIIYRLDAQTRLTLFLAGGAQARPADKAFVYLMVNYICDLADVRL